MRHNTGYAFTLPVGSFRPNDLGLHDMLGNVWEWCLDEVPDWRGAQHATCRVSRGGAWSSRAKTCRAACRDRLVPGDQSLCQGFRVALVPAE